MVGATGYEVDKACHAYDVDQSRVHINNALLCRPTKKLAPDQWRKAVECCQPRLTKELKKAKPKLILAFGANAQGALVDKWKIKEWAGAPLKASNVDADVLPTWHPAFAMRKPFMFPVFYRHFERAAQLAKEKIKAFKWPTIIIEPDQKMVAALQKINNTSKLVGIDVETAGPDPLAPLTAIGIGDKKTAVSCPWPPERFTSGKIARQIRLAIKAILANPRIEKAAQNGNHDTIAFRKAGMPLRNYRWDTMLMHGVVAPQLPHDLGFIAHCEFHADRWKSVFHVSGDEKGNARWVKALETEEKRKALCIYNAKDAAILAFLVPELIKQLKAMHRGMDLYNGYFERAAIAAHMRETGALLNRKALKDHRKKLGRKRSDALREFRAAAKAAGHRSIDPVGINPLSPKQIGALFFKRLRVVPTKWSDKTGDPSLDAKSLQNLVTHPNDHVARCARSLLSFRRWHKLISTYVLRMMPSHKKSYADKAWIIHPDARVQGTRGGRWSYKNPNCFTGDTEVLTPEGWIRFDKYNGERVAQFDSATRRISFTETTGYIKRRNASVLHLETTATDLAVTPDHRCLVYTRRSGKAKVFAAANYPEDHNQLHAGAYQWPGTDPITPDQLAFVIAVQADGYITPAGAIDFQFSKQRKAERLKSIMSACGIRWRDYATDRRARFFIPATDPIGQLARKYLGPKKLFGAWLLNISEACARRFDLEVWLWDGCASRRSMYASQHKINATWVQTVITLLSTKARLRKYVNQQGSVSWQVDVVRRDYTMTTNVKRRKLKRQTVYCVSVPTGFIAVRRNGCVSITGQCQNIPKPRFEIIHLANGEKKKKLLAPGLRDIIRPRPGNYLCEADYSQLELRIIALLAGDPILLDLYARNIDVHTENAKALFHTDNPSKEQRDLAKRFVYGVNYGGDAETIWRALVVDFPALSLDDVERLKERWYTLHPAIRKWQRDSVKLAYRKDYVECPLSGRRLYFHERVEETKVYNYPIQGTGADIIDAAFVKVDRHLKRTKSGILLFQIHDALIVEGPDLTGLASMLQKYMEAKVTLKGKAIKFPVDWKVSNESWGNCANCDTIDQAKAYQKKHKPAGPIWVPPNAKAA